MDPMNPFEACYQTMITEDPLILSRAQGSRIWDNSNREFIDLCAGFGSLALGHRSMHVVLEQLQDDCGFTKESIVHGLGDLYLNEFKLKLFQQLHQVMPPTLSRFALSLGGAGAIEIALKAAVLTRKTSGFLALRLGYHGLDVGALQVTGQDRFRAPFESVLHRNKVEFFEAPNSSAQLSQALEAAIRSKFSGQYSEVAALIVEPVLGRGGVRPQSVETLLFLREWTHKRGILLIFDEIFCGLGRTGVWTHASAEIMPDISVFGKALGGGFPTSVCAMTDRVSSSWPDLNGEALHTGTFFGHPFMSALACSTLIQIEKQGLVERSKDLGIEAREYLMNRLLHIPHVKVRGEGLMIGVDLIKPGSAVEVMHDLRKNYAVIAIPSGEFGEVLSITPALNIDQKLLLNALDKVVQCVIAQQSP